MFAYLMDENDIKLSASRGFWQKASELLKGGGGGSLRRVGKFYGDDMRPLGLLIGVKLPMDMALLKKICEKAAINLVACGEMPLPDPEDIPPGLQFTDGFPLRFQRLLADVADSKDISQGRICVIISEKTPLSYLEELSGRLRFLALAGRDKNILNERSEYLYAHNGTCAQVLTNPSQVSKCDGAIILDEQGGAYLRCALPKRRYGVFDGAYDEKMKVFAGKLGEIELNSSGAHALALDISSERFYNV